MLRKGNLHYEWKKANLVPVFKIINKEVLKNYRPTFLLPVSSKMFERLLYDSMFKLFTWISLILYNSLSFDSCTNQLLSFTYHIYKSLDDGQEVRSVFLTIFKVFGKVWCKGFIFNLKENGISGNLLSTLFDFFKPRKRKVVLNGQLFS